MFFQCKNQATYICRKEWQLGTRVLEHLPVWVVKQLEEGKFENYVRNERNQIQ